jgi:hypothetical protein
MTISLQSKVDELGRMLAMKQDDWLKALKEIEALESRLDAAIEMRDMFERLNLEGRDGHRATYKLIQAWAKGEPGAEEALRAFATPKPSSGLTYLTEPSSAEKLIEAERRLGRIREWSEKWAYGDRAEHLTAVLNEMGAAAWEGERAVEKGRLES